MNYKKHILKNSIVSVVQTVTSAFLLFFLYKYLLQILGAEQLGIWAIVLASTSVGRLSDMGFSGAALKFVARHLADGNQKKAADVVQTAALSIGLALAVLSVIAYPLLLLALSWSLPKSSLPIAQSILPWALLSLWFGMVAGIFQSALDGCQRMDIRNIILIICNVIYLGIVLISVPRYGLEGLAKGQLVQALILTLLNWYMLRRFLFDLPFIPLHWSKKVFSEMFSYAVNLQISSIVGLLFDPVTKFLLAKYGGLANLAYFEMANQVIIKVRALMISAFQSVVPVIAQMDNHQNLVEIYVQTYRVLFFLVWPYYVLVCLLFPLISYLWIGHFQSNFIIYGQVLSLGWMLSSLGLAAYFHNIGTGHLAWNTYSQILTFVINISLGVLLGIYFGSIGIVVGSMLSMVVPVFIMMIYVKRKLALEPSQAFPKGILFIMLTSLFAGLAGFATFRIGQIYIGYLNSSLLSIVLFLSLVFPVLLRHPFVAEVRRIMTSK